MFFLSFSPFPSAASIAAEVSVLWPSPVFPRCCRQLSAGTGTCPGPRQQRGTTSTPRETPPLRLLPKGTVPACPPRCRPDGWRLRPAGALQRLLPETTQPSKAPSSALVMLANNALSRLVKKLFLLYRSLTVRSVFLVIVSTQIHGLTYP